MSEAQARTTVSHEQDEAVIITARGQEIIAALGLSVSATYPPGMEDAALKSLSDAYLKVVGKINASRPAASTPQEGTTP